MCLGHTLALIWPWPLLLSGQISDALDIELLLIVFQQENPQLL